MGETRGETNEKPETQKAYLNFMHSFATKPNSTVAKASTYVANFIKCFDNHIEKNKGVINF